MKVKFIAKITADIDVFPDDVINSDTIGEYNTQLSCDVGNAALSYLTDYLKRDDDIEILSAEPDEEGIDEYAHLLDNWREEYKRRIKKYEG